MRIHNGAVANVSDLPSFWRAQIRGPGESSAAQHAVLALAAGELRADPRCAWSAFEVAWPAIERFVRARLLFAGLQQGLLEDCGQNVFLRVWYFRTAYRGTDEAAFWSWIGRICDNERYRIVGREQRRVAAESPALDSEPSTTDDPGVQLHGREALFALHECLLSLPADQRRIIELVCLAPAMSERAAAAAVGCSAANVHRVKSLALTALRDCLTRKGVT